MRAKSSIVLMMLVFVHLFAKGQDISIKNNLAYDITATPNLAVEVAVGKKSTIDIYGGYNPFTFGNDKRLKHWLFQPEYRYWFCEKFNGTFIGVHAHTGEFSVAGLSLFNTLKNRRYEGFFVGAGVSAGHQWILNRTWNLEASIGVGYAYIDYDKYKCSNCSPKIGSGTTNYFGVTRATISIVYILR